MDWISKNIPKYDVKALWRSSDNILVYSGKISLKCTDLAVLLYVKRKKESFFRWGKAAAIWSKQTRRGKCHMKGGAFVPGRARRRGVSALWEYCPKKGRERTGIPLKIFKKTLDTHG